MCWFCEFLNIKQNKELNLRKYVKFCFTVTFFVDSYVLQGIQFK